MTKHMNRSLMLAALAAAAVCTGCEKNTVQVLPLDSLQASRIKFFNFGVNAPGVNFYANDTKMTAILSSTGSEATTGVTYGTVGRSEEHTSELQSLRHLVCRLLLEKKKSQRTAAAMTQHLTLITEP